MDDQDDTPAGTLLGSGSISSGLVANTWTDVLFASPVAVEPGIAYRSSYHSSNGRHTGTPDFFASAGLTNGDIEAWVSGADPVLLGTLRNGSYRDSATPVYPYESFNETCYFVGPIFDDDPEDFDTRTSSMLLTF